jgi:hypothetical protein
MIPDTKLPASQKAEDDLVMEIGKLLNDQQFESVSDLLQTQFELRYRSAFGAALPIIENLFCYEVSRFARAYDNVAKELIKLHHSHVIVQQDSPLRKTLLQEIGANLSEIEQAIDLLAELEQLDR